VIYDYIVIGAGIAGASAAFELAASSTVLIIEAESQPGYHSSGRSAALFTRNYGTPLVRKINALSAPFFKAPPTDFTDTALLHPRGALIVAEPGEEALLEPVLKDSTDSDPVTELPVAEALAMVPFLRPDKVARAAYEPGVTDIDVAGLLQAYLKGFKKRGGEVILRKPVMALTHMNDVWTVATKNTEYRAKTLVNASGAWADQIGAMAGATPIGLVAKRRSAIIIDPPQGLKVPDLPCVDFAMADAYIKPDAGMLMVSPGDATPLPPQDVQPDEMDIAILVDWLQRETLISVRRVAHSWAGFRSFVADGNPVVGYDPSLKNFVWHAGHGGYGIMMAPSLARAVAALCKTGSLPEDFRQAEVSIAHLAPSRPDLEGHP
jgi:D-arginine dehydrogenase